MLTKAVLDAAATNELFTSPFANATSFYLHEQTFDATFMNFIVIGESLKKISPKLMQLHVQIEWKKIDGYKDIVAHDYFG